MRLLERAGYAGPRHFDAHAYRNENLEGVWDFATGCMRTYLALAERARHFDELPEVKEALEAASAPELALRVAWTATTRTRSRPSRRRSTRWPSAATTTSGSTSSSSRSCSASR